jgi:hypothetical protein
MRDFLHFSSLCVVACTIVLGVGCAADTSEQSLSRAEAKCVADNIDAYLDDPSDPVVIYLDLCSSFDAQRNIQGNTRADLPDLPNTPASAPTPPDQTPKSLTLSKAILHCLKIAAAVPGFPASDPVKISGAC